MRLRLLRDRLRLHGLRLLAGGFRRKGAATMAVRADVAELVDAHGSGPCERKLVEVQVLSSAFPRFAAVSLPDPSTRSYSVRKQEELK